MKISVCPKYMGLYKGEHHVSVEAEREVTDVSTSQGMSRIARNHQKLEGSLWKEPALLTP